jgi:hypothetical protein
VPEPALTSAVFDPYEIVGPYSKSYFVSTPLGLTRPFRSASVSPTLVAVSVSTDGLPVVEKLRSDPYVVPLLFVATTRK